MKKTLEETPALNTAPVMKKASKAALALVWILVLLALLAGAYFAAAAWHKERQKRRRRMAENGITNCSELVSYKCRYTSVVYMDKALSLGTVLSFAKGAKGYSIVRFTGQALGGIADTNAIKCSVADDGKKVTVMLPPAKILSNDIEKEEAVTEAGTFLRVSAQDMFRGIDSAREDVERNLISDGFLFDADKYARDAIKQMMEALKFEDIEVYTSKR